MTEKKLNSLIENVEILIESTLKSHERILSEIRSSKQSDPASMEQLEDTRKAIEELNGKLEDLGSRKATFEGEISAKLTIIEGALKRIPDQPVKQERTLSFSDITRKVLLWFFLISVPVTGISIYVGIDGYMHKQQAEQESIITTKGRVSKDQLEWLIDYYEYMKDKNPSTDGTYQEKHPFPKP